MIRYDWTIRFGGSQPENLGVGPASEAGLVSSL